LPSFVKEELHVREVLGERRLSVIALKAILTLQIFPERQNSFETLSDSGCGPSWRQTFVCTTDAFSRYHR